MTAQLSAASLAAIAAMTQAERDHAAAHIWDCKPNGRPVYTTAQRLALLYALQPIQPEELSDEEILAALLDTEELPADDPEATLRAMWTEQGVSQARQEEILAEITAKAQPGAKVGPFTIGRADLSRPFREELTAVGIQYVIPGCDKQAPKGRATAQLSLW